MLEEDPRMGPGAGRLPIWAVWAGLVTWELVGGLKGPLSSWSSASSEIN